MKRVIVTLLGVLLTTALAYADKPFKSQESHTFDLTLVSCDGYDLNFHFTNEFYFKWFFDDNGDLDTLHQFVRGEIEVSRDGFPDRTLTAQRADNQIIDLSGVALEGFVVNGILIKLILPGYGPLLFEVGRKVFDGNFNVTAMHGIHDREQGEIDAICAYFN